MINLTTTVSLKSIGAHIYRTFFVFSSSSFQMIHLQRHVCFFNLQLLPPSCLPISPRIADIAIRCRNFDASPIFLVAPLTIFPLQLAIIVIAVEPLRTYIYDVCLAINVFTFAIFARLITCTNIRKYLSLIKAVIIRNNSIEKLFFYQASYSLMARLRNRLIFLIRVVYIILTDPCRTNNA